MFAHCTGRGVWEGPVLEWMFLVVLPDLVLNSCLPIGSTWMEDSAAIINGLLLELLKTMASAGQVLTPLLSPAAPCQSLWWKYTGRSIWGRLSQSGLRSLRLRLSETNCWELGPPFCLSLGVGGLSFRGSKSTLAHIFPVLLWL